MALLSNLVFLAVFFASPILADFRMRCADFPGAYRIDPIDTPGTAAKHAHLIHGGVNFDLESSYEDLRASNCSSCQVAEDKSAYWVPSLHFRHEEDGSFEKVPAVGGLAVYYFFRSDFARSPVTPFPPGFRMIAGDSKLRTFPWPVPDPKTSFWTASDMDQRALRQKALGFNCLNYKKNGEDTLGRHFMPEKQFIDDNCPDGLRVELAFPSCWNGKDVDSPDHKSHVAYPTFVQSGNCPPEFPIRLPTLLYEVIFDSLIMKNKAGRYVFSNGDTTGFGNHGDFFSGWDPAFLQQAIDQCTDSFADITKCPLFKLQSDADFGACANRFEAPIRVASENCGARGMSLCGGNTMDGMSHSSDSYGAPAPPAAPSVPPPAPPAVQQQPPPPPPAEAPKPTTPPVAPPPVDVPHAHTLTSMIDGKNMIVFIDEVNVYEEVTTTISPTVPNPPPAAAGTNIPPHDDPPPPAIVPPPPAVTNPPPPPGPSTVYTTEWHDVTTTLVIKRHEHHARGHAHAYGRR